MAEDQIVRNIEGINKHVSLRKISSMQLKKCFRKGSNIYAVWVSDLLLNGDQTKIEDYPVLSEFMEVFREEILGLPFKLEIDFSIEIVPRYAPLSKIPYRMSIPELVK